MKKISMAKVYSLKKKGKTRTSQVVLFLPLLIIVFLIPTIMAQDILVWQGQYYTGTTFNKGTYLFNFSVYDSLTEGSLCYSNTTMLSTGDWGDWKTEQFGVSSACNNVSKGYFVSINIEGVNQTPRRRLTMFNFLRKDVDDIISADLVIEGSLRGASPLSIDDDIEVKSIFSSGNILGIYGLFTYLGNLTNRISKLFVQDIDVSGNLNVSGNISGNSYYGEMYLYNHSDLINIASQETWYNITNFTKGHNNGFLYLNSTLMAFFNGVYSLEYNIIFEGIKGETYYFAPSLNGVVQNYCGMNIVSLGAGKVNPVSNSCYIHLSTEDVLSLMVSSGSVENITIKKAELNVLRIGN